MTRQELEDRLAELRRDGHNRWPVSLDVDADVRAQMKRILAGIVIAVMLTGGAAAGPFEEGVAAHDRGDHATALRLLRPLAEQGNATAQYNLGFMYRKGEGVPQDYAEAVKWFRLAAEQGLEAAQLNLGVMYRDGQGVPQDDAEAVKWFRLAAERGFANAQYELGVKYATGRLLRRFGRFCREHFLDEQIFCAPSI